MIDVAFTPAEAKAADVAVVIDVLRATTTATQALASGYRRVLCVDSLERALRMRARGRRLAGEQHGKMPAGFDLGNSPGDVARDPAEELVLATTNGAPTIVEASNQAPLVLLACLMNLEAVRSELAGGNIQIVCSGTDGAIALEDVYVAGRLCAGLTGERTDAALAAEAVARAHPSAYDVLAASANAQALIEADLGDDIEYCARESVLDVVPRVERTKPGLAIVVAGEPSATVDGGGNVRSVAEPHHPRSDRATEPHPAS
ncbi:MAG: 2-phosphosulfolactate phosphatase [Actinomycetota bacterium]|nr:2-phosphosulfolactate phosphatase [Actinomycetota bacterium]